MMDMNTIARGEPESRRTPLDMILTALEGDAEKLLLFANNLADQLAPLMADDHPRPEEAPETPPGASPVVTALGNLHNRLGVVQRRLSSIHDRLEVG